jgi:hypothetical protein
LPGTYIGSFAIRGGVDADAFATLASVQFSVTVGSVQAVAEPNATLILATAVVIGWIGLWRRTRRDERRNGCGALSAC